MSKDILHLWSYNGRKQMLEEIPRIENHTSGINLQPSFAQ
jgi:hypothetical protein